MIEEINEFVAMTNDNHHRVGKARAGTSCGRDGLTRVALELTADGLDRPCVLAMDADEADELVEMIRRQIEVARKENQN